MQSKPFALLAAVAIAALIATGCSKGTGQSSTSATTSTGTSAPAASSNTSAMNASSAVTQGDATRGKAIFGANCSSCHGATGTEGGVGPPLKNEKSRKNDAQTVAWIKNPTPPMPKLYPSPLTEKDVQDVAAYVQGL